MAPQHLGDRRGPHLLQAIVGSHAGARGQIGSVLRVSAPHFNLIFNDITVRQNNPKPWWGPADFRRYDAYLASFTHHTHTPVVLWQLPLGDTKLLNNTWGHYRDNRLQWLLDDPSGAHLRATRNAGVVGLLFGGGADGTTTAQTDGGFLPAGLCLRVPSADVERRTLLVHRIHTDVLVRAKARLDRLTLYPHPVRIERAWLVSAPWLFALPWFRRFDGYTMWNLILLRSPRLAADEDLVCHELCHVWQMQHHPIRMPLSYLRLGYTHNPYEEEARRAAARTPVDSG